MAFENSVGFDFSLPANVDLSAKQYFFLLITSAGKADLCTGAAGEREVGVLQNDPTLAQAATIRYGGISKVSCGGTFIAGDFVTSDANGRAVKYASATVFTGTPYVVSGTCVYGQALEAGANLQKAAIILHPRGLNN